MGRIFRKDLLFFIIPFVSGTIMLLAFYPGLMTYDSIFQWSEAMELNFTNWHPAYHTIIIWLLTRIWESPAVVTLFQVFLFSGSIYYVFSIFKKLEVPFWLLLLVNILLSFSLLNLLLVITLWKDISYTLFVLLLTTIMLKIVMTEGGYLSRRYTGLFLGIVLANVFLLRHNGFPIVIGTVLGLFLGYPKKRFDLLKVSLVSLGYVLIFVGPIYAGFNVDRSPTKSLAMGIVFIHPIAAYVDKNFELSQTDYSYLNEIFPLENGWSYSCYDITFLLFNGVNYRPVQEDPGTASSILLKFVTEKPSVLIDHLLCVSTFAWQLRQPDGVYLETTVLENNSINMELEWEKYKSIIVQKPFLPEVNQFIKAAVDRVDRIDTNKIYWRPGIYLFSGIMPIIFLAVLKKDWRILLIILPVGLHTFFIMFTAPLQAVRYLYPVHMLAMCFFAPISYLIYKDRKEKTRELESRNY